MRLNVKVVPKSSRTRVVGWMGEALKVCVTAAPEKGRANEAVETLLAEALGLARDAVRVVAGGSSPRKIVEIDALDEPEARRRLAAHLRPGGQ